MAVYFSNQQVLGVALIRLGMKNQKRLRTVNSLLLISALTWWQPAQVPSYSMRVVAFTSVSGQEFQVAITRSPRFVRVRYAHRDSIRYKQLEQDPDNLTPDQVRHGLPDQERMTRYRSAVERHKVFTQDSIQLSIKYAQPFVQLLDSVYEASAEALEQKAANQKRFVLDGTAVSLFIKSPGKGTREVYAHSPQAKSHPLLYRLLHESLQVYRTKHPNSFLTLRATSGY